MIWLLCGSLSALFLLAGFTVALAPDRAADLLYSLADRITSETED